MDEVVEATVGLLRRRAIDLGVEVRVELQAPARVKAGAGELDHVILNLLSNALDAVAEPEGIRREVFVSTWAEPEVIWIRIRDTGPGIDQSLRDQLFDLFASKRAGWDSGFGYHDTSSNVMVGKSGSKRSRVCLEPPFWFGFPGPWVLNNRTGSLELL